MCEAENIKDPAAGTHPISGRSVYVHVPFCRSKCRYCDFYSFAGAAEELKEEYTLALLRQISAAPDDRPVTTVYFGGGTPTLLGSDRLCRVLDALGKRLDIDTGAEVTVEMNPNTQSRTDLERLRRAGFNRLSVGFQALDEKARLLLGRTHGTDDFLRCMDAARGAGFDNISADMIFALPDTEPEKDIETAEFLCSCKPEHISAYELSYEEGTPLYGMRSRLSPPDEETVERIYDGICAVMKKTGYGHYEISNFSLSGYEARHNVNYWKRGEYLPFGAAAHGFIGGKRFSIIRDCGEYIRRTVGRSFFEACDDLPDAPMSAEEAEAERVMLGLRLAEGIDAGERLCGERADFIDECKAAGLIRTDGTRIALTERGWRVSNSVIAGLILWPLYILHKKHRTFGRLQNRGTGCIMKSKQGSYDLSS